MAKKDIMQTAPFVHISG